MAQSYPLNARTEIQGRNWRFLIVLLGVGLFLTTVVLSVVLARPDSAKQAIKKDNKDSSSGKGTTSTGDKLVFTAAKDGNGNPDSIYAINWDGSRRTKIIETRAWITGLVSSPGGNRTAFTAVVEDEPGNSIYTIESLGANPRKLTEGRESSWSPDGNHIVFIHENEVWKIDADGGNKTQLTAHAEQSQYHEASWSPGGDRIAWLSDGPEIDRIYVMNADGTRETQAVELNRAPIEGGPTWSADGSRIAYTCSWFDEAKPQVWTVNPDGSDLKALTDQFFYEPYNVRWFPDGKTLAFMSMPGGQIFTIGADGSGLSALTGEEYAVDNFFISSDGERIAFGCPAEGMQGLYVVNADGTDLKKLVDDFPVEISELHLD